MHLLPFLYIAAGWTVSVVATPVELIKARLQVQYDAHSRVYSGPIDCAQQLVRDACLLFPSLPSHPPNHFLMRLNKTLH